VKCFEPIPHDARIMDKDVLTTLMFDKSVSLLLIEPFHSTDRHCIDLLSLFQSCVLLGLISALISARSLLPP